MKFVAEIDIIPHKELLDPPGKAAVKNRTHLHIDGIEDIRIGKHILLPVEAGSKEEAQEKVDPACRKWLANLIMESYTFDLKAVETQA